ncbi:hypothetical protein Tco_1242452 [Tanacetum coccineum]
MNEQTSADRSGRCIAQNHINTKMNESRQQTADKQQIQTDNKQQTLDSGSNWQQRIQTAPQTTDITNQAIFDAERAKTRQNQKNAESDVTNITKQLKPFQPDANIIYRYQY